MAYALSPSSFLSQLRLRDTVQDVRRVEFERESKLVRKLQWSNSWCGRKHNLLGMGYRSRNCHGLRLPYGGSNTPGIQAFHQQHRY